VLALLPFATLPVRIGFTPTFLDLALVAIYLVFILRLATQRERQFVGTPVGAAVALFMLAALSAFANGLRVGMPTAATLRNFAELMMAIGLFFVVVNWARRQADLDFLTRLALLAGTGAAAIAVVFYVLPEATTVRILDGLARLGYPGGYGALRYIEDSAENPMRAIGTMVDPNVLGGFLVLVGGLTAPQLASAAPLFRRRWVILFFGVQVLALYLTYSRGSLAGLAAGLLLVGLLRYRKLLGVAMLAGLLLLVLPPAQAYLSHLVEGLLLQDRATLMRVGEYRDALSLIARYPWFGVGFTGSPDADLYVGVSNVYLLIGETMGILGLVAFLAVLVLFFVHLWRAWKGTTGPRHEALVLGCAAAVAGGMMGGIFDHYLFNLVYPHMSVLFWTILGLGMAAWRLSGPARDRD